MVSLHKLQGECLRFFLESLSSIEWLELVFSTINSYKSIFHVFMELGFGLRKFYLKSSWTRGDLSITFKRGKYKQYTYD